MNYYRRRFCALSWLIAKITFILIRTCVRPCDSLDLIYVSVFNARQCVKTDRVDGFVQQLS